MSEGCGLSRGGMSSSWHSLSAGAFVRMLLVQTVRRAWSLVRLNAGRSLANVCLINQVSHSAEDYFRRRGSRDDRLS